MLAIRLSVQVFIYVYCASDRPFQRNVRWDMLAPSKFSALIVSDKLIQMHKNGSDVAGSPITQQ